MRLFVAVNLNDEMKDVLMDIQDAMRTYGVRGRETHPDNMHLTLAFIGEYDDPGLVKSAFGRGGAVRQEEILSSYYAHEKSRRETLRHAGG